MNGSDRRKPEVTSVVGHRIDPQYFTFTYDGKFYKILPKPGVKDSHNKLKGFLSFIENIASKKNLNPWTYNIKPYKKFDDVFDIVRDPTRKKDDYGEQMSLFASITKRLDKISEDLETKSLIKEAYDLDVISNTLDKLVKDKN